MLRCSAVARKQGSTKPLTRWRELPRQRFSSTNHSTGPARKAVPNPLNSDVRPHVQRGAFVWNACRATLTPTPPEASKSS